VIGHPARSLAEGVERDARTVMTPRIGWLLVALSRMLPGVVESKLVDINQERAST